MFDSKTLYNKLIEAGWNSGKIKNDPVAKELVSQSTLTRLKNGGGKISVDSIENIAILLNIQPLELLEGIWEIELSDEPLQPKTLEKN